MNLLPENMVNLGAITIDKVIWPEAGNKEIILEVLRLDKIDLVISGNKWFKLKYYLQDALQNQLPAIITFGGAYSNHILATACATQKAGLQSIGIIRGERPAQLSPTLIAAEGFGMKLVFVSREQYNQKKDPAFISWLLDKYGPATIIPEGGEGDLGIKGAAEIVSHFQPEKYTHVLCAVGTGTVLSGLMKAITFGPQVIGIPVLKGFEAWLPHGLNPEEQDRLKLITGYHFGGYAKKDTALIEFMNEWHAATHIPSDFVYTGKLFFAIDDLLRQGFFPQKSKLLIIHSGGLQGNGSLPAKTLNF